MVTLSTASSSTLPDRPPPSLHPSIHWLISNPNIVFFTVVECSWVEWSPYEPKLAVCLCVLYLFPFVSPKAANEVAGATVFWVK